jgi:HK97 family phage portal protein
MGIFSRIFGSNTPAPEISGEQGKAILDPIGTGWTMLSGNWPFQWKEGSDIFRPMTIVEKEMAYRHPLIKACCDEIAYALVEPQLEYGYWKDKEWVSQPHPALETLKRPFTRHSQRRLLALWVVRYLLAGLSYLQKFESRLGEVAAVVPYPTSWVTPTHSQFTGMIDYYTVNGQNSPVPPESMIILEALDPGQLWGGVSALDAACNDYYLDCEKDQYLAEMMENLKVAGMIIMAKNGMHRQEREDFKRDVHNAIGKGSRGNPLILSGDYEISQSNPLSDMDWPSFQESREARVCMSFGIPPILIGSKLGLSHMTYSNYQETRRSFYMETLSNLWPMMEEALNFGFLKEEEMRVGKTFRFRKDLLSEFQEDLNTKSTRIMSEYTGGLIPKEKARAELHYDTDELRELDKKEKKENDKQQTRKSDDDSGAAHSRTTGPEDSEVERETGKGGKTKGAKP